MDIQSIMGVVRTLLAAAGGYFVAKGYLDPTQMESIVGGLVVLLPAVWSVFQKKGKVAA